MTEQQLEGNKQILIMMGIEHKDWGNGRWFSSCFNHDRHDKKWGCSHGTKEENLEQLYKSGNFHEDYNWMMDAIDFMLNVTEIGGKEVYVEWSDLGKNNVSWWIRSRDGVTYKEYLGVLTDIRNRKEAIFAALTEFATFYNEKKASQ